VEESQMRIEKRPSHHCSLYTIGILSVPAVHVNKKSYKIIFLAKQMDILRSLVRAA
jgi:hypothetical protein